MPFKDISVAEASRKLKVGTPYIYTLIWSGKLPARKRNGRWLIDGQALRARIEGKEK